MGCGFDFGAIREMLDLGREIGMKENEEHPMLSFSRVLLLST